MGPQFDTYLIDEITAVGVPVFKQKADKFLWTRLPQQARFL